MCGNLKINDKDREDAKCLPQKRTGEMPCPLTNKLSEGGYAKHGKIAV